MRFIILLMTFLSMLCGEIKANEGQNSNYERYLKSFEVREIDLVTKKVYFILDNGWVFTSAISSLDEHKLYSLHNLLNTRVSIRTHSQIPGLEISFENPHNKGYDKISFLTSLSKEIYDSMLFITDIRTIYNWFVNDDVIILSDNSYWRFMYSTKFNNYYAPGDRVLITKNYNNRWAETYTLINLDISDNYSLQFKYDYGRHSAHMIEPLEDLRSIEVYFYPTPTS